MSASSLKSIGIVERLCGLTACPGFTIVTTMWANLQMAEGGIEEGTARERELQNTTFFGTLVNNGANFRRHLGSKESAQSIVSELLRGNATIVLDIQKQLVDDRLILGETPVGRYVQEGRVDQRQMPDARQIKEEHDQPPNLLRQLEIGRQGLNMNFDQLAEHKNSEYASLLEPVADQSMEEENELLNSARAQLSRLERELETQLQEDRQYNIDEQTVIQQMMSEIQRHQLAVSLFRSRRRAWISYRLLNFYNCI
jgi:hypothetical protein